MYQRLMIFFSFSVTGKVISIYLVAILFPALVFAAPAKKPTPKPTAKSPVNIHCALKDNIHMLINHLPHALGALETDVYTRYQRIVSLEKKYLHNLHLHSVSTLSTIISPLKLTS